MKFGLTQFRQALTTKNKIPPLFYIVLFSLVIHFVSVNHAFKHPNILKTTDSDIYLNAARNLDVSGVLHTGDDLIPSSTHQYSHRPPAYPFVIFILKKLWDSDYVIIILQVILNYINFYLLWKIMNIFRVRENLKLAAAFIFLFYPPQIFFMYMIIAEVLLQTFLLLSLFFLAKYLTNRRLKYLLLFNLMLCFTVLTKPLFVYFWVPNIIFHIYIFLRSGRKAVLVMPLLLIAVIFSWSIRNYYHTGYFHYSSSKHLNILEYYLKNYVSSRHGIQYRYEFMKKVNDDIAELTFTEASVYIEKLGEDIVFSDWLPYAQFHLRGAGFFFVDPGRFEIYQFMDLKSNWDRGFQHHIMNFGLVEGGLQLLQQIPVPVIFYLILMGVINTLLFLLFIYSIVKKQIDLAELKIFIVLVVFYIAIITGPLGASRYRLPVFPYLLIAISVFVKKTGAEAESIRHSLNSLK